MTPLLLRVEIQSGPMSAELAPLVTAGDDSGVAAALNRADRAFRRPVEIQTLSGFCAGAGITGPVMAMVAIPIGSDISAGNPMTLQVKSGLNTVMTIIQNDYRLTTADLDNAAVTPVLDLLAALGILTTGSRAAMMGLQAATRSRAGELGWPAITANDVSAAYGRI